MNSLAILLGTGFAVAYFAWLVFGWDRHERLQKCSLSSLWGTAAVWFGLILLALRWAFRPVQDENSSPFLPFLVIGVLAVILALLSRRDSLAAFAWACWGAGVGLLGILLTFCFFVLFLY